MSGNLCITTLDFRSDRAFRSDGLDTHTSDCVIIAELPSLLNRNAGHFPNCIAILW